MLVVDIIQSSFEALDVAQSKIGLLMEQRSIFGQMPSLASCGWLQELSCGLV